MSRGAKIFYSRIRNCRLCGSLRLFPIVRFEPQYCSSLFVRSSRDHPLGGTKIPMTVVLCMKCGLCQLRESILPGLLYKNYGFRSNVNEASRQKAERLARELVSKSPERRNRSVLDVGCNDGTLLSFFPSSWRRTGVDPAGGIARKLLDPSIEIIRDRFPTTRLDGLRFSVITCVNTLYEFPDLGVVMRSFQNILEEDGLLYLEVAYLGSTLEKRIYNDFCHEHLSYFSLGTLLVLLKKNGLKLVDAALAGPERSALRVIAARDGRSARASGADKILREERRLGLDRLPAYTGFARDFGEWVRSARRVLRRVVGNQKMIGLGASTKGNVLLQFLGFGKRELPYISERNREKVGLRTLGTDIPIISEEEARRKKPQFFLALPWNYEREIVARERGFLRRGGRILFLLPHPHLVSRDGKATF